MRFLDYHEHKRHGSNAFPIAIYPVSEHHPRYNMPYHWHHEYEIIYIDSGSLRLTVNDREFLLQEGDTAIIESGALHGGTPDHCHYCCIVFHLEKFLSSIPWATELCRQLLDGTLRFPVCLPASHEALNQSVLQLKHDLLGLREDNSSRFLVLSSLLRLLGELLQLHRDAEDGSSTANGKQISQLKTVLSYISQHYADEISLQDLAACAGMNPTYFCRFFSDLMHRTPMNYLNYYRIESACEQLAATNKTITEIAFDCGFHDTSYFVKVFKKHQGVTPSQYQKKRISP